jgi:hypothetical protein
MLFRVSIKYTRQTQIRTNNMNTITINGAKDLKKYIDNNNQVIQQIREEYLRDIQQPAAIVQDHQGLRFPKITSWTLRADLCRAEHASFVYKRTGLPQFSTFLQSEAKLNEALNQLEDLRKMLVTNKQQKKTTIRKIHDIIKLVRQKEQQDQRLPSPTFDFVTTMATDDDDDYSVYDDRNDFLLEAEDSAIVKELKAQIETTKQNHRTISRNLLQQVKPIVKAVRHYIVDVKKSAEDNVGDILHHAEKCRAFISKCFDLTVLEFCAHSWWHQTQKDPMDHNFYRIEVQSENPDDSVFNPNVAARTEHNIRICVYDGNTNNPASLIHQYDYDQDLLHAIYTQETICEVDNIIRHFNSRANVVATCEA